MIPDNNVLDELYKFFVEGYILSYDVNKSDLKKRGWSFEYKDAPDVIPEGLNVGFDQLPNGDITGDIRNSANGQVIAEELATDQESYYHALIDVLDIVF